MKKSRFNVVNLIKESHMSGEPVDKADLKMLFLVIETLEEKLDLLDEVTYARIGSWRTLLSNVPEELQAMEKILEMKK